MRAFLFIVTFFFITSVYGQTEKAINIPAVRNYKNEIDTSLWFKRKSELAKQIKLKDLKISTDTFHFRLWTDIQAIDIWTVDQNIYFGTVTNYAQRYDQKLISNGVYRIDKVFSNQETLDTSKARQIFILIDTLSIVAIPTDDKIKGWQPGLDGEEFIIENSTPKEYYFKTYWTPRFFAGTLIEAKKIQTLVDRLQKDFKIQNYYNKLKLPQGSYHRNGIRRFYIGSSIENSRPKNSITDWF